MNKRIGAFMPELEYHILPYLFAVTCKGRRGVILGTNLKDVKERAEMHFYYFQ
jgi:hypothetical protein